MWNSVSRWFVCSHNVVFLVLKIKLNVKTINPLSQHVYATLFFWIWFLDSKEDGFILFGEYFRRKFLQKIRSAKCTNFPLCIQTKTATLRLCRQKFPIILLFSFPANIRTSTQYLNIIWYSYIYFLDAAASNLLDQFKLSVWASVRFKQHLVLG